MTAPIPEDQDQQPTPESEPPGEHGSELPGETDTRSPQEQEENAETSLDEPSDDSGGE